ncbi:MAG: hypothetical protein R3F40_15365 [Candidatus Competibacteraceae bacterium]
MAAPGLGAQARDIVTELREGLNGAYRQLRELIATFRLKMEHPRLEDSLREVAREFSHRSQLPIELNHSGWNCPLDPNEQIHVMQSSGKHWNNAVKHARAQRTEDCTSRTGRGGHRHRRRRHRITGRNQ